MAETHPPPYDRETLFRRDLAVQRGFRPVPEALDVANPLPVPLEAFPGPIQSYIEDVARSQQATVDLAVLAALGVLSGAVNWSADGVRVNAAYREGMALWLVGLAPPSSKKSPILSTFSEPVTEAEKRLRQKVRTELPAAETAVEIAKLEEKAAKAAYQEALKQASAEGPEDTLLPLQERLTAAKEALAAAEANVPSFPHLRVSDTTPEALTRAYMQHPRVHIVSAEPASFGILAGAYNRGHAALQDAFLKGWSHEALTSLRVNDSRFVEQPHLNITLLAQPGSIDPVLLGSDFANSGFLARLLGVRVPDLEGRIEYERDPEFRPNPAGAAIFEKAVLTSYGVAESAAVEGMTPLEELGPATGPACGKIPPEFTLTPEALEVAIQYRERIENEVKDGQYEDQEIEWVGKAAGQALRIAAVLHVLWQTAEGRPYFEPISVQNVQRGIQFVEYFRSHLPAFYGTAAKSEVLRDDIARAVNSRQNEIVQRFPGFCLRRDVQRLRSAYNRQPGSEEFAAGLERLQDMGWVRLKQLQTSPVGRHSEVIELHPTLWADWVMDTDRLNQEEREANNG